MKPYKSLNKQIIITYEWSADKKMDRKFFLKAIKEFLKKIQIKHIKPEYIESILIDFDVIKIIAYEP